MGAIVHVVRMWAFWLTWQPVELENFILFMKNFIEVLGIIFIVMKPSQVIYETVALHTINNNKIFKKSQKKDN